jgi:cytochrome c-type biogenesis protein CcmF
VIAELGLAALWLAAALALLQLLLALGIGRDSGAKIARPLALVQGVLTLIAFAALIAVFLRTDLSVELVAANSHSAKPWLYKFAGAWGNHEGSMLLWVTVLSLSGAALAVFERRIG